MVERTVDNSRSSGRQRDGQRCLLYRIFDPTDSGASVVTVSYNSDKDETTQASVSDTFRLNNVIMGSSFLKSQKTKIQTKELDDSYKRLIKPDLLP